jgi:hypothetical protein
MSQTQTPGKPLNPPTAPPTAGGGGSIQDEIARKQLELLNYDLTVKAREAERFQTDFDARQAMRLAQALESKRNQEAKEAGERNCGHQDEYGRNSTRGNRGSNGKLTITCQKCRKQWRENEHGALMGATSDRDKALPSNLYPRDGQIGGFAGFQ